MRPVDSSSASSDDALFVSRRRFLAASVGIPLLASRTGSASANTNTPVAAPTVPAPKVTKSKPGQKTEAASFIQHGARTSRHVALTFHGAGSAALANQVLALTKRLKTPVTVFAVGNWVDANPELAKAFRAAGHELGNHTYSHPALRRLGRAAVATEISGAATALNRATGSIGAWFRPSGTPTPSALMLEEAAKVGYETVVGYDVDPRDYQDPGSKLVVSRTTAGIQGGSIVSLHLGHQGTVDALEAIISAIRARGLEPATVSTVLHD